MSAANSTSVEAHVVQVEHAAGRLFAKLQMVRGELRAGEVLWSASGIAVRIEAIGFSRPELWNAGLRVATIIVLAGDEPPVGTVLKSDSSTRLGAQ